MRVVWVFLTLVSHWRRRPFQLLTLVLGLAIATALWSGVQALNAEARASYDEAAAVIGGETRPYLVAEDNSEIGTKAYVALRRAGWHVSPILESDIVIEGRSYRVVGVDPVTLPIDVGILPREGNDDEAGDLAAMLVDPSRAFASRETLTMLDAEEGEPVEAGDTSLPPITVADTVPPMTLITDIAVASVLTERTALSRLVVTEDPPGTIDDARALTGLPLDRIDPETSGDLDRLTESFHLNLTAFGFLAFLVGLFIVNAATGLAFEQRRPMLRTMRACGVSARALAAVMLIEMVALALVAGLLGVAAGYGVASALLPDVAASLRGLYGANVAGELSLSPLWWVAGIAISVVGALAATGSSLFKAYRLPLFATAAPHAWALAQRRVLRVQTATAIILALAGAVLYFVGHGLVAGFALMGCVLLAAALSLPPALAAILAGAERLARGPLVGWFLADARQQLSGLSLALMALLLALGVNIGVGTMVDSFRLTFTGWLDQRLAAELYVGGETADEADRIAAFLDARDDVDAVLPVWNATTRYRDWPVEVYGFRDHPTYTQNWPLLASAENAWADVAAGGDIMVSEQLARRFDLGIGDEITIPAGRGDWTVNVAGIYSDYGNPRGQIMIALDQLLARFSDIERDRFAVRVEPGRVDAVMAALRDAFALTSGQLVNQQALKAFSQSVFERTFAVTLALNALTLIVAGIALLASQLTLAGMRLPQLAPLWAMGLTRRRLALMELAKALALAALTALLAVPLGLAVAWILMSVVNVEAFGWRLPVHLFPMQWVQLVAMALLTAIVATAWPAMRLRVMAPSALLKVFADER
ncbi:ABC transporter permease [Pararhizobium haloflavum]|uniref:ABC transporter permease n=1 Tax=Pararhizobium haloflavum TaxID=2037914 RepID=UPI00351F81C1